MTLAELFVVNRAIDGQDVYGVPSFADLHISNPQIAAVKTSMVEKGLLAAADSFTADGAKLAHILEKYKSSEKYVGIGSVVVGLLKNTAAAIWHNPVRKDYVLSGVELFQIKDQLLAQYPFLLQRTQSPADEAAETVSSASFISQSKNFAGRSVALRGYTVAGATKTKDTVYLEHGRLYHYNWMSEIRRETYGDDVLRLLDERFTV